MFSRNRFQNFFLFVAVAVSSAAFGLESGEYTIVAFGDSTTAIRSTINNVYADNLRNELPLAGITGSVINSGVGGMHTGTSADNSHHNKDHALERYQTTVLAHDPDIIIMQFGINDSWLDSGIASASGGVVTGDPSRIPYDSSDPRNPAYPNNYLANLRFMVQQFKAHSTNPIIVLMTSNQLGTPKEQWRNDVLSVYAQRMRDVAASEDTLLVDVWQLFGDYDAVGGQSKDDLLLDGVHPNDAGHRLVADAIYSVLGVELGDANPLSEQRNSGDFKYKYEANSSDPVTENPDDWAVFSTVPTVESVENGILRCGVGKDQMWFSTAAAEADLDDATGWTYEVRLKVISQIGGRGAISLSVDDQVSTAGGMNGIQIHADRTQWNIDGANADQNHNDDGFHIFRLAEEPSSNIVHGWRDGEYLGSANGGHDFTQSSLAKYVMFGSFSSSLIGTVEIDYVRWDPTGAYAPYSPLLINAADGLKVNEHQETSDSYTITLKSPPQKNVTVSISAVDPQITFGLGEIQSTSVTFTPSNIGPVTIRINAVDDDLMEGIHSTMIQHTLTSDDPAFDGIEDYLPVSIVDNDTLLALENNADKKVYEEGLTSDSYILHCLSQPEANVVVEISTDSDKLAGSTTLTFTPDNWQTAQTVILSATDNTDWNRMRYYPVVHNVKSDDLRFDGFPLEDIEVLVWDNDYRHVMPSGYTIPTIDMDQPHRQVVVDKEQGVYLAHPTTVLLEDGRTILAVYPRGSHARGECVLKRSTDGGLTWGERLKAPGQPADWVDPGIKEVPTIHRVIDGQGKKRLIIFTGLYPCRMSVSEDDGLTWTPFTPVGDWGGIVTMGCVERLKDGSYMALFHDDGRFFPGGPSNMRVYKTISIDGGLTWSNPEVIVDCIWASPCEPGIFRSPDGNQLAVLFRENSRKYNGLLITSNDEGNTWSDLRELPASLTGDRHTGKYGPDGRLFISFRDRTLSSPTSGDWVGWVGTYDDIVNLRQGQYRVRVKDNTKGADTAYPGVEILPNGEFVTTTYGWWEVGEQPYIVSSRFRLSEIDAEYKKQVLGENIQYCGQDGTFYLGGDIDRDCFVGLADLMSIAEYWLDCTDPFNPDRCVTNYNSL